MDEVRKLSRYSERQQDRRKEIRKAEQLLAEKQARQKELTETVEQLIDFLGKNPLPQYVGFESAASVATQMFSRNGSPLRTDPRAGPTGCRRTRDRGARPDFAHLLPQHEPQEAADDIGLKKSWASRLHARALKVLQSAFRRDPA